MKHLNKIIKPAWLMLLCVLALPAAAQMPEQAVGQEAEQALPLGVHDPQMLTLFGFDLPVWGQKDPDHLTPVPQEDALPGITPFPEALSLPETLEFKPLLPDLSHLHALMRDPDDVGLISPSPIAGVFEVVVAGEIYYLSQDGRYLFEGNLLDLQQRRNLSDAQRNRMRSQLLAELNDVDVIAFPIDKPGHEVTVFIDVDCPYCRVIYDNVAQYNQLGIEMRFAPFPRNGPNSLAHAQLSAVWCAADRKTAMQQLNQGLMLSGVNCQEIIKKPHILGLKMGVTATPTFVLENGRMVRGYVAPQNLARLLAEGSGTTEGGD